MRFAAGHKLPRRPRATNRPRAERGPRSWCLLQRRREAPARTRFLWMLERGEYGNARPLAEPRSRYSLAIIRVRLFVCQDDQPIPLDIVRQRGTPHRRGEVLLLGGGL